MTIVVVPDPKILSRGWNDWILFAEVQELLRERGSKEEVSDSIAWAVLHQRERYVRLGVLLPGRVDFWSDSGADLSSRLQAWLDNATADDPVGPAMSLFFEITDRAVAIIPEELQF